MSYSKLCPLYQAKLEHNNHFGCWFLQQTDAFPLATGGWPGPEDWLITTPGTRFLVFVFKAGCVGSSTTDRPVYILSAFTHGGEEEKASSLTWRDYLTRSFESRQISVKRIARTISMMLSINVSETLVCSPVWGLNSRPQA